MLQVGQTLWYIEFNGYRRAPPEERGHKVTVTKIGRHWAELGSARFRINVNTLLADGRGYSPPGRCYLSREAYLAEISLASLWGDFTRRISRINAPDGITEDAIRQAACLLCIPLGNTDG